MGKAKTTPDSSIITKSALKGQLFCSLAGRKLQLRKKCLIASFKLPVTMKLENGCYSCHLYVLQSGLKGVSTHNYSANVSSKSMLINRIVVFSSLRKP